MQYDRATGDDTPPPAEPVANEMMISSTLKHVTGYSLEQYSPDGNWSEDVYDRINFDAVMSPMDLEETYFPGFKLAIEKGHAGGKPPSAHPHPHLILIILTPHLTHPHLILITITSSPHL